jgi:FkbM family methyltransferase
MLKRATYELQEWLVKIAKRWVGIQRLGEHSFLGNVLNRDSVVVDLGANRGKFYLGVQGIYGARCYVVEAAPDLFARLPAAEGAHFFNCAIHSCDEKVRLSLSGNSEANSLDPAIAKRYGLCEVVEVPGKRLKSFILENRLDRIDLLKVDIEGSEVAMFDSTRDETFWTIRQIAIEFHDFLDPAQLPQVLRIVRRMRKVGFTILPFSSHDWREVLMLNMARLPLSPSQKLRIQWVLKPVIALKRIRSAISGRIRGEHSDDRFAAFR